VSFLSYLAYLFNLVAFSVALVLFIFFVRVLIGYVVLNNQVAWEAEDLAGQCEGFFECLDEFLLIHMGPTPVKG
jgi:hypothetical protein